MSCWWHVDTGADDATISIQSQVAVVQCMKAFVKLHNEDVWMSWTIDSIDVVLEWILNGVDDTQLQRVCYALYTNRKATS